MFFFEIQRGVNKKGVKDSSFMVCLSSDFILSRSISAEAMFRDTV